jgi:hypothetical protein
MINHLCQKEYHNTLFSLILQHYQIFWMYRYTAAILGTEELRNCLWPQRRNSLEGAFDLLAGGIIPHHLQLPTLHDTRILAEPLSGLKPTATKPFRRTGSTVGYGRLDVFFFGISLLFKLAHQVDLIFGLLIRQLN